ncbi:MAG: RNA polymerase-binding protein DksA [Rhodanobacteraceae bacterium]
MAKPKQRAAGRSPKAAKSAAKPARAKSPNKAAAKVARKAPVRAAHKVTKPAPRPGKAKAAKPATPAAKKVAKSARHGKSATSPSRSHTARGHGGKPAASVRASTARAGHGTPRAPARKPVHVKPTGGIAARLSVATADEQTITREDGRYALPATVNIDLPKGYHPSGKEEYMSPRQLAYFRQKLKNWRDQLVEESRQTMENLRDEVRDVGDDAERATRETENSLELRTRDRYRKLISKIEKALRKIEEGRYGYCEETDEEIGLERLEARPIATLSLDAQERREHLQKQMGD